jgi:chromosome segregation ATPase
MDLLKNANEKLTEELAKANKRIDKLQSELHSSNDRADEMFYKLQEVDAVTMDTLEWISLGVCPGSNQHLPNSLER